MAEIKTILQDEDGRQYIVQKSLWHAKNVVAYMTTDGHVIVSYDSVADDVRDVYLARFYQLAKNGSNASVLRPEALLAAPDTGYVATVNNAFHQWSDDIKPEDMSVEDYEDWLADRGGLRACYETAISFLSELITMHREGHILGTLKPEEIGIEDDTRRVVFLRADGLLRLAPWHDERPAHNTLEENSRVLPLLRSLLFPWPLGTEPKASDVEMAEMDIASGEPSETGEFVEEEEEAVAAVENYLTEELHAMLFPAPIEEGGTLAPVSLEMLLTACQRAMQQLQCCPSCETWFFSHIGQTNECPICGWPEESTAGARLCIRVQPTKPIFISNEKENSIKLPSHAWLFSKGKQHLDIRPFLPKAIPTEMLAPLVSIEMRPDGTIWLENETQKPLLHEQASQKKDLIWPGEAAVQLIRHESRIEFPELPLAVDGEEIARTKIWMEIE